MRKVVMASLAVLMALGGCSDRDEGTSITINSGAGAAALDGNAGAVSIDTPLFKANVKLPKIDLTAENFDINGVHLYPGSAIRNVDVNARGGGDGVVKVKFDSPAAVATVRDWLAHEFEKAGTTVKVDGNRIEGRSEDKPFRIDLSGDGGKAAGEVTIG